MRRSRVLPFFLLLLVLCLVVSAIGYANRDWIKNTLASNPDWNFGGPAASTSPSNCSVSAPTVNRVENTVTVLSPNTSCTAGVLEISYFVRVPGGDNQLIGTQPGAKKDEPAPWNVKDLTAGEYHITAEAKEIGAGSPVVSEITAYKHETTPAAPVNAKAILGNVTVSPRPVAAFTDATVKFDVTALADNTTNEHYKFVLLDTAGNPVRDDLAPGVDFVIKAPNVVGNGQTIGWVQAVHQGNPALSSDRVPVMADVMAYTAPIVLLESDTQAALLNAPINLTATFPANVTCTWDDGSAVVSGQVHTITMSEAKEYLFVLDTCYDNARPEEKITSNSVLVVVDTKMPVVITDADAGGPGLIDEAWVNAADLGRPIWKWNDFPQTVEELKKVLDPAPEFNPTPEALQYMLDHGYIPLAEVPIEKIVVNQGQANEYFYYHWRTAPEGEEDAGLWTVIRNPSSSYWYGQVSNNWIHNRVAEKWKISGNYRGVGMEGDEFFAEGCGLTRPEIENPAVDQITMTDRHMGIPANAISPVIGFDIYSMQLAFPQEFAHEPEQRGTQCQPILDRLMDMAANAKP